MNRYEKMLVPDVYYVGISLTRVRRHRLGIVSATNEMKLTEEKKLCLIRFNDISGF